MSKQTTQNLISFDEVIRLAKLKGVKFGKADPYNRLRYYVKIGLLPKAVRKSFNGQPPSGAFPIEVVDRLVQIDQKLKNGKTIQLLNKEEKLVPPAPILQDFPKLIPAAERPFYPKQPQYINVVEPQITHPSVTETVEEIRVSPVSNKEKILSILKSAKNDPDRLFETVLALVFAVGLILTTALLPQKSSKDITHYPVKSNAVSNLSLPSKTLGTEVAGGLFTVNLPTVINDQLTTKAGIVTNNTNIDAGTGTLTASNVIYSIKAGNNVSITGGQNPTISVANVQASIFGTLNRISVSNNTIDIASNYAGQNSISLVGTVTSGTWQATPIAAAYLNAGNCPVNQFVTAIASSLTCASPPAGGNPAFTQILGGTNTGQALVVGNASTLAPFGTGKITANAFVGTGSTTDAVDLGTAEVAGILPAASVGNGITNAQLANSSLTITAGTGLSGGGLVSLGGGATLNLTNTAVTIGSYGSASQVATFTVDQQGRLTAAGNTSIAIGAAAITSGTLTAARGGTGLDTSLSTGVPSISVGTWSINAQLPVSLGGTGANNAASARSNLVAAASGANTDITSLSLNGGIGTVTSATSITSSALTLSGFNCTTFANGGKLTTDNLGAVSCQNDVSGAANPSFSTISSGINTTAAMQVGTGASLAPTGTGTITANAINLSTATISGTLGVSNGGTGTNTTFTAGSVVFAGASGVYSQNNTNFFWDNSNTFLGLGTNLPATRLDVTGLTLNTNVDNTVGAGNFTANVTKNDALTKTFSGLNIKPTFNTGLSNTTTTFNILNIDSTNTATTGLTTNLIKASYGGSQKFVVDSSGSIILGTTNQGTISAGSLTSSATFNLPPVAAGTYGFVTSGNLDNGLTYASNKANVRLDTIGNTSATTTSPSGLEITANGLTLLHGCTAGSLPLLKWTGSAWACAADNGTGAASDLQTAYAGGNTIATTTGRNIAFTLSSGLATPTSFTLTNNGTADALVLTNNATVTNAILVNQNTSLTTLANAINITQTLGSITNGLSFNGTFTNLINSANFSVSNAGVITLAGAQTADITTAAAATTTGLTFKPGTSSGASSNGAGLTLSAGDGSGTTSVTGGLLTLTAGSATGGAGTRNGGSVFLDAGTGLTANGNINIGTANALGITIGRTGGGALSLNGGLASSFTTGAGNIKLQPAGPGTTASVQIGEANGGPGSLNPDLLVLDQASGANPAGVNGALLINSAGQIEVYDSSGAGAWKVLCNKVDQGCGTGSGSALSAITAAAALNTINNGDNAQVWNWSLTTAAKTAFTFGESSASTNGVGNQYILSAATAAASTAAPFNVNARGNKIIDTTAAGGVSLGNATVAQAVTIDAGTGTLNLGNSNNARTINIGTGTAVNTIHLGDGGGADVITLGSATSTFSFASTGATLTSSGGLTLNNSSTAATLDAERAAISSNSELVQINAGAFTQTITGAVANARFNQFLAPTLSATTAQTVTNAATVYIDQPPIAAGVGPATITNPASLLFGNAANQIVLVQQAAANTAGKSLSITSGAGNATTLNTGQNGGNLNLTAGAGSVNGTAAGNGGDLVLSGGAGAGTGTTGKVGFFNATNNFINSAGNLTIVGAVSAATATNTINSLVINGTGTISGTLTTLTPSGAFTVGATSQNLTLQGATTQLTDTAAGITNSLVFTTPATSNKTITIPNETGTICTSAATSPATCSNFAPASGGSYLAKNANDTSSASFLGNLYGLTNTNTGAAGVLSLTNAGTNSTLSVTQSANPTASQALIFAKNTAVSPAGNLLDLQVTAGSKFSIDATGALTAAGAITAPISTNTINSLVISSGALSSVTGITFTSGNFDQSGSAGAFKTGTGAVSLNGDTTLAASKNLLNTSGTGTFSWTYANTNGTSTSLSTTDSASSGITTVNSLGISLIGTNNPAGSNTINAINFPSVTAATNNTFNGLNFGTGYSALLRYNSNNVINGTGLVQTAFGGLGASVTASGAGDVVYASSTTAYAVLANNTTFNGYCLKSNGVAAPGWATCPGGSTASPFIDAGGTIHKDACCANDPILFTVNAAATYDLKLNTSVEPTADLFQITTATNPVATTNTNAASIVYQQGTNIANITGSALDITLTPSGDVGDTIKGVNFQNVAGAAGPVTAINIGTAAGTSTSKYAISIGSGWDKQINGNSWSVDGSGNLSAGTYNTTTLSGSALTFGTNGANTVNANANNSLTLNSTSTGSIGFFNIANNFISNTGALTIAGDLTVNGTGTANFADSIAIAANKNLSNASGSGTVSWSSNITTGNVIADTLSGLATTTVGLNISQAPTYNGGAGITNSGNLANLSRSLASSGAGTALSVTGAVLSVSDNCSPTAPATCANSANVLSLTQSFATASGAVLGISNSGTGNDIVGTGSTWSISKAGSIVGVGVNFGAGLLQGTGGETITGAISDNTTGSGSTNIGSGTNTGTIVIGNSTSTAIKLGKFTTANGVLYVSAIDGTVSETGASSSAQCLISASAGAAPTWGSCGSGVTVRLDQILAATSTPVTIDSTNFGQTWNWSTLTTQRAFTFDSTATGLTTGGILGVGSGTTAYNHGAAIETGNLMNLTFADATNGTATSTTNGINIAPTLNVTGASGTKTLNAINIAPTLTACTGGSTCATNGINLAAITNTAGNTATAIKVGTGWDTVLGGTIAGTNLIGFTNFTVSTAGAITAATATNTINGIVINSGALTSVSSLDTIATSATALTFAGAGTISATGANALTLQGGASGALTLTGNAASTWSTSTGALTINAGSSGLNLQADGLIDVNIAGGSGATGCTITNSNGNLACSGTISTTATSGTQGWWTRGNTAPTCGTSYTASTICPSTANDVVFIQGATGATDITVGDDTNAPMNGTGLSMKAWRLTSGYGIRLTGSNSIGSQVQFTGAMIKVDPDRKNINTGNVTDDGNYLALNRTYTTDTGGFTHTSTANASLVSLTSNCTALNTNICVDHSNIININQQLAVADAPLISITNAGIGANIAVNSGDTSLSTPNGGFGRYENELLYSEDFSQVAWTLTTETQAQNVTAPNGVANGATTLTNGTCGACTAVQSVSGAATSTTYTFSVWLKAGTSTTATITLAADGTGTPTTNNAVTLTTSWQRFSVSNTTASNSTTNTVTIKNTGANTTGTVLAWGAQLEKASSVNIYQYTNSSAQTNISRGSVINLPSVASGTINGLTVNGSNATGGTENLINVPSFTGNGGNINALNINNLTPGAGTQNAINIGTGWNKAIQMAGTNTIGATGATTFSSTQTTGTVLNINPVTSVALSTPILTGLGVDLSTNYTTFANGSYTGAHFTTPDAYSNSLTKFNYGINVDTAGLGNITSTANTTTYAGVNITIPGVTQTGGTISSSGVTINLPSGAGSITTGGTINGINIPVVATGPGAGTLNGININNITTPGAGTQNALNIGSGWNTGINITGTTGLVAQNAVNVSGYSYALSSGGQSANLASLSFTNNSTTTNASTNSVNGISVSPTINGTGAATGTLVTNAFNVNAPTIGGSCATGASIFCTSNGININTITSGAASTLTNNGVNIVATGISAGLLNAVNIATLSPGAGTQTAIKIGSGWNAGFTISSGGNSITQQGATSGTPTPAFTITNVGHFGLTAGVEASEIKFDLSQGAQFNVGALTTQRAMQILSPIYSFSNTSTLTNASTLAISGPPISGANATLAVTSALRIDTAVVNNPGAATNAVGLYIDQPTGATNNAAILLQGAAPNIFACTVTSGACTSANTTIAISNPNATGKAMVGIQGNLAVGTTSGQTAVGIWDAGTATTTLVGTAIGAYINPTSNTGGLVPNFYGIDINTPTVSSGSIASNTALFIISSSSGGTNNYGIQIGASSGGTGSNYGLYFPSQSSGGTSTADIVFNYTNPKIIVGSSASATNLDFSNAGTAGTYLRVKSPGGLDSTAAAGTLNIGNGNATTLNIMGYDNGTTTETLNIGTPTTGVVTRTINLGLGVAGSSVGTATNLNGVATASTISFGLQFGVDSLGNIKIWPGHSLDASFGGSIIVGDTNATSIILGRAGLTGGITATTGVTTGTGLALTTGSLTTGTAESHTITFAPGLGQTATDLSLAITDSSTSTGGFNIFNIANFAGGTGSGAKNGINIGNVTAAGGSTAKTALNIGTGWNTAILANGTGAIKGTNVVTGGNSNSPAITLEGNGFTAASTNTTGSFSIQTQPGSATTAKLMFSVTGFVAGANVFSIDQAGNIRSAGTDTNSVAPDIAENVPVTDMSISAGDIVEVDPTAGGDGTTYNNFTARKSTSTYSPTLLGVISTDPGIVLNGPKDLNSDARSLPNERVLTIAGRVPTKVSTENGAVSVGDPLTSSSTPGVAMKATQSGPIIGKALEAYSGTTQTGKILVFVHTGWYVAPLSSQTQQLASSLNGADLTLNNLNLTGMIAIGNKITADKDGKLTVNGQVIVAGLIQLTGDMTITGGLSAQTVAANEFKVKTVANDPAATAGAATLATGQTQIVINTTKVAADSLIFVTPTVSTNQNLAVTTKTAGSSFTVTINSPAAADITFNWIIINQVVGK